MHVDALCLRVSDPVPNQLCVYFHEQVHAVLCRFTSMGLYLNCCTSGSLSILWCFLRSSLCCRSVTGSCFVPERVRVHLVPVWIGLQGNEWLSLLLKDGLRGIKHPSFASFLTLRSKKFFIFFSVIHYSGFLYSPSSLPCLHIMSTGVQIMCAKICKYPAVGHL